jgi:hypothetical protein
MPGIQGIKNGVALQRLRFIILVHQAFFDIPQLAEGKTTRVMDAIMKCLL